mgnify:CR=1 FL=1
MTWFNRQSREQRHAKLALEASIAEYQQVGRKIDAQLAYCREVGLEVEIRYDLADPSTMVGEGLNQPSHLCGLCCLVKRPGLVSTKLGRLFVTCKVFDSSRCIG